MPIKIENAIILAAGRGSRMRDLTNETPKPLIEVNGKALIDYMVDKLVAYGLKKCVVNVCYLGDKIKAHLLKRTDMAFVFSEEQEALETGGGIQNARHLLGNKPFFALNADPLWTEPDVPCLTQMAEMFEENKMDILLLLWEMEKVFGHTGKGDYFLENKRAKRILKNQPTAPYVYAGAQILCPHLFEQMPQGKYSLNLLYDKAEAKQRLYGVVGAGQWFHVGTPEAHKEAEENL